MGGHTVTALCVLALVVVVIGLDVLIFRHQTWARLVANIGIVMIFAAFYMRFQTAFGGK